MSQYRKKPVVVEAVQFHGELNHPALTRDWLATSDHRCEKCGQAWGKHASIVTLESRPDAAQIACPGDWIITGIQGEHYPSKPDIFEATYAPVTGAYNDMAEVGSALMETLKRNMPDYSWSQSPAEVVTDLLNQLHDTKATALDSARGGMPEEPTEEMIKAGERAMYGIFGGYHGVKEIWKAMLAADTLRQYAGRDAQDARRYRWLRKHSSVNVSLTADDGTTRLNVFGDRLDSAIDTALLTGEA